MQLSIEKIRVCSNNLSLPYCRANERARYRSSALLSCDSIRRNERCFTTPIYLREPPCNGGRCVTSMGKKKPPRTIEWQLELGYLGAGRRLTVENESRHLDRPRLLFDLQDARGSEALTNRASPVSGSLRKCSMMRTESPCHRWITVLWRHQDYPPIWPGPQDLRICGSRVRGSKTKKKTWT